jgi:hypothetical protein
MLLEYNLIMCVFVTVVFGVLVVGFLTNTLFFIKVEKKQKQKQKTKNIIYFTLLPLVAFLPFG